MSTNHNHIDDLLLEGDAESMQAAADHAAGCAECAEALAAWNEISGTAKSMRATWKSDLLWPRIERSLRQERRGARGYLWQIAAAVVVTIALGAGIWRVVQVRPNEPFVAASAIDEVERAERAHVRAIAQLERVAEPKLEEPATPLIVSYKEKLVLLDDAIAECERNIQQNRLNAHLRKQLLSMYLEKQRTLQEVLREDTHVANQ
ncbi:MAG: hypothetical protein ACXVH7_00135 [Thermoanaerobaculia bacterium]